MTGKTEGDFTRLEAIDTPQGLVLVYDRGKPTQRARINYVPEAAISTSWAILTGGQVERHSDGATLVVFDETKRLAWKRLPIAVEVTRQVPGLAELVRLVELVEAGRYEWDA